MRDTLERENKPEVTPPEGQDRELLEAWASFASIWALKGDAIDSERRTTFYLQLERQAQRVMNLRPTSLLGIKAKLVLCLCSGHDAGPFLRHYVEGRPLPRLLTFADPNNSQIFDAVEAIDRMIAAERKGT